MCRSNISGREEVRKVLYISERIVNISELEKQKEKAIAGSGKKGVRKTK